jgi:hypothetical protein
MGVEPTTSGSTDRRSAIELQPPYIHDAGYEGWLMGVEPTTLASTVRCSAIELQPPCYMNDTTFVKVTILTAFLTPVVTRLLHS